MTEVELVIRIGKVFGRVFGPAVPFSPDLGRLDEPRWTSLKHVELLVALEGEFGVQFDGGDATDMTGVTAVIDKVRQRLS